jgi:hypothetical protein
MKIPSLRLVGAPALGALIAASALAVGGCYVESTPPTTQSAVAPPPPPPAAPAPPAPPEVVVEDPPPPPPPPPVEPAPPAPPAPGNVWVAGNYSWNSGKYEWQKGHYERPPRPSARHVPGHWEARAHGRAWVAPHWE